MICRKWTTIKSSKFVACRRKSHDFTMPARLLRESLLSKQQLQLGGGKRDLVVGTRTLVMNIIVSLCFVYHCPSEPTSTLMIQTNRLDACSNP